MVFEPSLSTDEAQRAARAAAYVPQPVGYPQLIPCDDGQSVTFTVLIDGRYYTAERVRPDFPHIDEKVTLVLSDGDTATREGLADIQNGVGIEDSRLEARIEWTLLERLLKGEPVAFGDFISAYVSNYGVVSAASPEYYEALKILTTVWLRTAALLGQVTTTP